MATYQQKWVCCRREWCPTCLGVDYLHGPYWYATWRPWVHEPGRSKRNFDERQKRAGKNQMVIGRLAEDRFKGAPVTMYIGANRWPELGTEGAGDPPPAAPRGWAWELMPGPFGRHTAERAKARYMRALIASRKLRAKPTRERRQLRRVGRRNPGAVRALRRYLAA